MRVKTVKTSKAGKLAINGDGRLCAAYPDGTQSGGLHCGQPLLILVNGDWELTTVDFGNGGWKLKGLYEKGKVPINAPVIV